MAEGNYVRTLREEAENEFITRAVAGIQSGETWDQFLAKNPQYTIADTAKWHMEFERMQTRRSRSKVGEWGLESEMNFASAERMRKRRAEADEAHYQQFHDELLECASKRMGWQETRRTLDLPPESEQMLRRAQRELGISRASERPDPADEGFALGFFGS